MPQESPFSGFEKFGSPARQRSRAEASRENGAKSRGPTSSEGKERSSMNAMKHGLRAKKNVVLIDEDADEFEKFAAAMKESLSPVGALEEDLAARVASAAWRVRRSDTIEAGLLDRYVIAETHNQAYDEPGDRLPGEGTPAYKLGGAFMRDGEDYRAIGTMLRYRGSTQAEYFRALKLLKALQAERAQREAVANGDEGSEIKGRGRAEPNEPETRVRHRVRPVSGAVDQQDRAEGTGTPKTQR